MTTIKYTDHSVHLNIPNFNQIDASQVYTRSFFDAINIKGFRIYVRNEPYNENTQTNDISQSSTTSRSSKFSDIFGKEQFPNGYSTLPLKLEKQTDKTIDTEEEVEDTAMLDHIRNYLGQYQKKNDNENNEIKGETMVTFPLETIFTLNQLFFTNTQNESIYQFSNSDATYEFIENILRDLFIQSEYLKQNKLIYNNVTINSIYRIQERFVILDSSLIEPINEKKRDEQESRFNESIVALVALLIGVDDQEISSKSINLMQEFEEYFEEIENTRVFYVLKRMENDGVFQWI
jgi:hypothetical protein